jgi:L-amino acid N-acyltransferase YncA
MLEIRLAGKKDYESVWPIIHEVFQKGDTYAFSPDITKEEAFNIWMDAPRATYIAISDGKITGTYYIKANQPELGAHVCNAGYIVNAASRGQGIGRAMCEHSLGEARMLGFKAMQYNLVVATNIKAIKLWINCGFKIIGTLPKAFNHFEEGLVDAIIMYQWLDD